MATGVKPKLLIFYDYFSPAYKAGGPVRSLANLTALLQEDFEIWVFTAATELDGTPLAVEKDQWIIFGNQIKVFYASQAKLNVFYIQNLLKHMKPDTVYINGLYTPYSVLFPLLALKFYWKGYGKRPKVVIAPRGMLKESALALKAGKKTLYLKVFKLLGLHKNIVWHATDGQEVKNIRLFAGDKGMIKLSGNVPVLPALQERGKPKKDLLQLASVSLIAKTKNLLFLIKVLKKLKKEIKVNYEIYGPVKDQDYWELIMRETEELPANIQISFKGPLLPDQVQAVLQHYNCFVLPTLGENFGHAIFEAMGAGLPVLISDQTPWRNLENRKAGWDLPLQEQLWIDKLTEIAATDAAEWQQWQEGAYLYAVEHLKKQNLKEQYLELFGVKL